MCWILKIHSPLHEAEPNPSYTYTTDQGTIYFYGKGNVPFINKETGSATAPGTIDRAGQRSFQTALCSNSWRLPIANIPSANRYLSPTTWLTSIYPGRILWLTVLGCCIPLGINPVPNCSNTSSVDLLTVPMAVSGVGPSPESPISRDAMLWIMTFRVPSTRSGQKGHLLYQIFANMSTGHNYF